MSPGVIITRLPSSFTHRELAKASLLFIIAAISSWFLYEPAFHQGPRSDQIIFLQTINQAGSPAEKMSAALGYQRLDMNADTILFRPFTFGYLGGLQAIFGNQFYYHQLGSFFLHLLVSGLLTLWLLSWCQEGYLAGMFGAFFCLNLAAIEMVTWTHVGGYLLFCVFFIVSLFALRRKAWGIAAAALSASALFHECGLAFLLLTTAYSLLRGRLGRAYFLVSTILVLGWNLLDYLARIGGRLPMIPVTSAGKGAWSVAGEALHFWLRQIFVPTTLRVVPALRTEISFSDYELGFLGTVGIVSLAFAVLCLPAWFEWRKWERWRWGFTGGLAAVSFVALMVLGRLVPRGLSQLYVNTYYAYFLLLFLLIALAPILKAKGPVIIIAPVVLLCFQHAWSIQTAIRPLQRFFHEQSQLLGKVEQLVGEHGGEKDFTFSIAQTCPGQYAQNWPVKGQMESFHWIRAAYPKSFRDFDGKYLLDCEGSPPYHLGLTASSMRASPEVRSSFLGIQ